MEYGLLLPSFIAGLFTFFAPCTLPLIPGYLGMIGGPAMEQLKDPQTSRRARRTIFLNGVFFVIGFSFIFIVLGLLFGFFGSHLEPYKQWFLKIGGIIVILFGLHLTGLFNIRFFNGIKKLPLPASVTPGKPLSALIVGASFGFGWTPCLGPILGTILFIAWGTGTAFEGGILLFVFSLGLAIPFLLVALGIAHAFYYIRKLSRLLKWVEIIGGLFLIFLGILLLMDDLGIWISWLFGLFRGLHYDAILQQL